MGKKAKPLKWDVEESLWYYDNGRGGEGVFIFPDTSKLSSLIFSELQGLAVDILISVEMQGDKRFKETRLKCDWHEFRFRVPDCELVRNAVALFHHCENSDAEIDELADFKAGYLVGLIRNDFHEHAKKVGLKITKENSERLAKQNDLRRKTFEKDSVLSALKQAWMKYYDQKTEAKKFAAKSLKCCYNTLDKEMDRLGINLKDWAKKK